MGKKKDDAPKAKKKDDAPKAPGKRLSWLDEASETILIDRYAKELDSFLDAMADGKIVDAELHAQEKRLVELMKSLEPKLDDELHAEVSTLLCELTAYNLMQITYSLEKARPKTSQFRG